MFHKNHKAAPIDLTLDSGGPQPTAKISKRGEVIVLTSDDEGAPTTSTSTRQKERPISNLVREKSSPRVKRQPIDFTENSPARQVIRRRKRDAGDDIAGNRVSQELPSHLSKDVGQKVSVEPRRTVTPMSSATPRKLATPRRGPSADQLSTPDRRDRNTFIDDLEIAMDENSGGTNTFMAALENQIPGGIEPELPKPMQFGPVPAFAPVPPAPKQFKRFTEWTVPDTPLEFEKIQAVWDRNAEEFKDDHARYASDKMERERIYDEKAGQTWLQAQKEIDARTAETQTSGNWWDAPALSRPAVGKASNNAFTLTFKPCVKGAQATKTYVEMSQFQPKAISVPHYRTYYPVKRSQLVQSDRDLLFWPEATERDGLLEDDIQDELKGQFHFRMLSSRSAETAYWQIGRQWQPYAEAFLEELNLSEEDVLRFLVDSSQDHSIIAELKKIKHGKKEASPLTLLKDARKELLRSPQLWDIRQNLERLAAAEEGFADLKAIKFKYLALAFYAVSSCYKSDPKAPCFNFVYCLNNSPSLDVAAFLRFGKPAMEEVKYSAATHFDLACRICHVYPCFVHGLDSVWDYRPPVPIVESDDSDNDSVEDTLCPLFDTLTSVYRQELGRKPVRAPAPVKERAAKDLEFGSLKLYGDPNDASKATVFFPCNHQGPCEKGLCHCAHRYCEKSCGCDATCKRRFKGCKCARKSRVCSQDSKCACLAANRECDPDLCGVCGVYDVLDPQNRDKDASWLKDKCQNCAIQKNVPKRTLIGESTVHGIGLFAGEAIKKGELIGEYVGAKLNWKQAERSGLYLLLNGYSYLFDMTGDQTVDSMVLGNKMRFINSIPNKWNCEPRVYLCNTEHRMALYATKDIPAGEELSFNYGDIFFDNHKDSTMRKREKAKLDEMIGTKKKKKVSVKKGKRKAKGNVNTTTKETVSASTTHKTLSKDARPRAVNLSSTRNMVPALDEAEGAANADVGAGAGVELDAMEVDSPDDSMDEDFKDEDSEAEIDESEADESDEGSSGASSWRARKKKSAEAKKVKERIALKRARVMHEQPVEA